MTPVEFLEKYIDRKLQAVLGEGGAFKREEGENAFAITGTYPAPMRVREVTEKIVGLFTGFPAVKPRWVDVTLMEKIEGMLPGRTRYKMTLNISPSDMVRFMKSVEINDASLYDELAPPNSNASKVRF